MSGRGFAAIGVYQPKREVNVGGVWRAATLYGAAYIYTVGSRYQRDPGDTPRTPLHTPLHHYADVDDLVEHLPHGCPLIGVELDSRAVSLTGYRHPQRAAYLLGAEDHGLPPQVLERCHEVVVVPTPRLISHNVATAGALVLHDRYVKRDDSASDGS